jgi:hypothetical protein
VLVSFSIGRYNDEVLYNVVLMHRSHILLGKLWQFNMKTLHDGFKNNYSFVKDNKSIIFIQPREIKSERSEKKKVINKKEREMSYMRGNKMRC